jgi:hypothetical protein
MPRTNNPNSKAKRSYSLSRGSVEFLEKLRKKHRARSVSAVLEELVLEARRQEQLKELEASMTAYYDSLTDEEQAEDRAWAALGAREAMARDFGEPVE